MDGGGGYQFNLIIVCFKGVKGRNLSIMMYF